MPVPPPLTRLELIEIRDGNLRNADVRRLLHEVRRLRVIVLNARQYLDCEESHAQHTGIVRDILRDRLAGEPCILEMDELKAKMREDMNEA